MCNDARPQPISSSTGVEASRKAASSVTCRRSIESGEKPSCTTPKQPRPKKTSACKKHLNETRQKFGETLEALGCICRALLARNLESCCTTSSRPSSIRPKLASSTSSVTPGRSPVRHDSREQARPSEAETRIKDSCCSAGKCSSTSEDDSKNRLQMLESYQPNIYRSQNVKALGVVAVLLPPRPSRYLQRNPAAKHSPTMLSPAVQKRRGEVPLASPSMGVVILQLENVAQKPSRKILVAKTKKTSNLPITREAPNPKIPTWISRNLFPT
jgi:hypothetical protein